MWMDHQANSSAARKQMSCRALLPDIQRHRQNDGLKNGLCEPRPVLQRAKASSDQSCLLTSANSEGEGGRTSVSERARASEGVCYFNRREGCGSTESRTSRVWTSWVSRAPTMGRRPKATCQFSARSTLGNTPYSCRLLTTLLTTPNVRCRCTFSEHHPLLRQCASTMRKHLQSIYD